MNEGLSEAKIEAVKQKILSLQDAASIEYIDKSLAKSSFKDQMATYAPTLFNDEQFANPFPASFIVTVKSGLKEQSGTSGLTRISKEIQAIPDIEDVSYGQTWVQNFSKLASALSRSGWTLIGVLLAASLLIISNSLRMSISSRKDEIQILELVGATANMIRAPFIFEAAVMGFLAMTLALVGNYSLYHWSHLFLKENLSFTRISEQLVFLRPQILLLMLILGPAIGALSAFLTIRKINSGWAAAEGRAE